MSVTSQYGPVQYTCNGAVTEFAFPYLFLANADLLVYTTDEDGVDTIITSGITITGALDNAGGEVTFAVAPATGLTLTIERHTPLTQPVDYVSQDNFPAETHERALDRLTLIVQEQKLLVAQVALSSRLKLRLIAIGTDGLPVRSTRLIATDLGDGTSFAAEGWMVIAGMQADDGENYLRSYNYSVINQYVWSRIS